MSSASCPSELLRLRREGAVAHFIASWSEHKSNLRLQLVTTWELSCGTEPLTCGKWICQDRCASMET